MDYNTLLEKVEHLTTTLSDLQEFIDIKFDLDFKEFLRKKHSPPGTRKTRSKCGEVLVFHRQREEPNPFPTSNNDSFEPECTINGNSNKEPDNGDVKIEVVESFPYYDQYDDESNREGDPPGAAQFFENNDDDDDDNFEGDDMQICIDPSSAVPPPTTSTSIHPKKVTTTPTARKVKGSCQPPHFRLQRPPAGDPLRHIRHGITYKMSFKGNEKLVHNSYEYCFKRCRQRRGIGRIDEWSCDKKNRGCGARIIQTEDGTPTVAGSGHNHDAS